MSLFDTLFPRRSQVAGPPRRGRVTRVEGRLRGLGSAERLESRRLLAITGVERTTPADFFIDTGRGFDSGYTAYTITSDGLGPAVDVWVRATNFTAGNVGFGPGINNEDGTYRVGLLDGGVTNGTAYLYFTASGPTNVAQTYDIEVFNGDPDDGGTLIPGATKTFTIGSVQETIAAEPNKIDTVSFSPANPVVGDLLSLTVGGVLGNGADRVLFAPATRADWQPDVFELRATDIVISGVTQPVDRLSFDPLPEPALNQQPFTAVYTFLVARPVTTPTAIDPTQYTQDGAQDWKHHKPDDTPFPPIPPVSYEIALAKGNGSATYLPGGTTTWTITLTNTGKIGVEDVLITDVLPVQVDPATTTWTIDYVNASSGTLGAGGTGDISGTVNLGPMTGGMPGTVTITIVADILPDASGAMTNCVMAAPPEGDPLTACDTDLDINLTLTKDDGTTTYTPGGTTTYEIVLANTGLADLTGVVIQDLLPPQIDPTSTWAVSYLNAAGTLPAAGSGDISGVVNLQGGTGVVTITIVAKIFSSATGPLTNTVTVTLPDGPTLTASDTNARLPDERLTLTKDDGVDIYVAGESTTYTITLSNVGLSDVNGLVVSDILPSQLDAALTTWYATYVDATGTLPTVPTTGEILGAVNLQGSTGVVTITIEAAILSSATGSLTNTVNVTNGVTLTASDTNRPTPRAVLEASKSDGVDTVTAGDGIVRTYTLTVTNNGPSDAQGVLVDDTWPAGFELVPGSFTASQGMAPTPDASGNFTWDVGLLPAGATATLTVDYTVPSDTPIGIQTNSVVVTSPTDEDGTTAFDDTSVITTASLAASKTDLTDTVTAGDGIVRTYTLTVTNNGPSDAQGVLVDDTWPAGFALVPGSFTVTQGMAPTPDAGGNFTWDVGVLPAGVTATLTVNYTVPSDTPISVQTNSVVVTSPTDEDGATAFDDTSVITVAVLVASKSDGVDTVTAGDGIVRTYTLTVTNNGPSDAQGVMVDDTWPAGFALVPGSFTVSQGPIPTPAANGDFTWTVGLLPAGATATLTVDYTVPSDTPIGIQTNSVVVTSPTDEDGTTALDDTSVITTASLAASKTDETGTVTAGDGIVRTYTLTVTNNGPSDAQGVMVDDTWPAGFALVPGSFTVSQGVTPTPASNGDFTWDVGVLPAGVTATLTVNYTVPSDTPIGVQTNSVVVTSPTDEDGATASDDTSVITVAVLAASKSDGVDTVTAGDGIVRTYTLTVTNNGPSDAQGVMVDDTWPAGFALVPGSFTVTQGPLPTPDASGNFTWDVGLLPQGVTATLTVDYTVPSGTPISVQTNSVVVMSPTDRDGTTTFDETTVVTSAVLSAEKSDGVDTVTAGDGIVRTYTLTVTNTGPSDAQGVLVDDTWPAGFALVPGSFTVSQGPLPTPDASGNFTWDVGLLPAGVTATLTVSYTVPSGTLPGIQTNSVIVTSPTGQTTATASDETTVTLVADLSILKTDGQDTAIPGTAITYTITVRNFGPSDVLGAVIDDTLPAAIVGATWTAVYSAGSSGPSDGDGSLVGVSIDLLAGGTAVFTISGTIDPLATDLLVNTVTVTPPEDVDDPNPGDETSTDETTLVPTADLAVTKERTSAAPVAGELVSYRIVVTNLGPSSVTSGSGIDVTTPALLGAIYTVDTGTFDPGTGVWTADPGDALAAGESIVFTLTGTVPASASAVGTLVNQITVAPPDGVVDPDPDNNTAEVVDPLVGRVVLVVAKSDGQTTLVAGDGVTYTYTITVTNNGPSDAQDVVVNDSWPAGFAQDAGSFLVSQGVPPVVQPNGDFAWSLGTLAAGTTATLTVNYTVPSGTAPGIQTNSVIVTSPTGQTSTTASDETTVTLVADLSILKTDGQDTAIPGTAITYTITVRNFGPSDVLGAVIDDTLPAAIVGATWTAVYSAGSSGPSDGSGSLAGVTIDLLAGGAVVFTISGTIDPLAAGLLVNTARVTPPEDVDDPNPGDETSTDETTLVPTADLAVMKERTSGAPVAGEPVSYRIVVTNRGPSSVTSASGIDVTTPALLGAIYTVDTGTYDPATGVWTAAPGDALAAGESIVFTLTGTVPARAVGTLVNQVTVAPPDGVVDPDPDNNTAEVVDPLVGRVVLTVSKDDGSLTYKSGGTTTWTIVVTNTGPSVASGVRVEDPLPPQVASATWTAIYAGSGSTGPAAGAGSIDVFIDLAVGGTVTFTLQALISDAARGDMTNTVTATPAPNTGDPVSATDVNAYDGPINPQADLPGLVLGTDDGCNEEPFVRLVDAETGDVTGAFLAYEMSFRGSVRVATGDVTGDGSAEIIVAPGRNRVGEIRVFTPQGVELTAYRTLPFGPRYRGGVEVAAGDVNGDGIADIVAGMSSGIGRVSAFLVNPGAADPVADTAFRTFRGAPGNYRGGVMIAAGDVGTFSGGTLRAAAADGLAEIVVGLNAGRRALVRVFDVSAQPRVVQTIRPFGGRFQGGVTLSTAMYASAAFDDILIGAGPRGQSAVEVYSGTTGSRIARLDAFASFARPNAAVFAAALDLDGDGIVNDVYGVQGRGGTGGTDGVKRFERASGQTSTLTSTPVLRPPLRIAPIVLRVLQAGA